MRPNFVSKALVCSLVTLMFCLTASFAMDHEDHPSKSRKGSPVTSPTTPPMDDEMINIPFFSETDGMHSVLTLNNNKQVDEQVDIALYDMDGNVSLVPSIILKAASITNLQLKDLLKQTKASIDSGSLTIGYDGNSMDVTAQVGVSDVNARIAFESRDVDMMDFVSSSMNAAVWIPEPSAQAFLALNNIGADSIKVHLSFGKERHDFSLSPHQSKLMNLNEHVEQHGAAAYLLTANYDGAAGSLAGTGYVINRGDGYSSGFILVDPATAGTNHLAGAHVRFGLPAASEGFLPGTKFKAHLSVANVSNVPTKVKVSVDYTRDSEFTSLGVDQFVLAPSEIRSLDLENKMADLGVYGPIEEAGVDIQYDGKPGSVVASATSVDSSGDYSFEVPIKDASELSHMSEGSYPWTLENGTTTVLHLKNTTGQSVKAQVLVRYSGGIYSPDQIELKPFQTLPIDIRKLKKKEDIHGKTLPKNAMSGTITWVEVSPKTMIGRAEQLNIPSGIARSFSCGACTCPNNLNSATMNPTVVTVPTGYNGSPFTPTLTTIDCNGFVYGPFTASPINSWSATNSSVATVNSSGSVSCVGAGSGTILAEFQSTVYTPPGCNARPVNPQPGGTVNGKPVITGGHDVWYFNSQNPDSTDYPISVTLTSSGGASTSWTLTQSSARVSLSVTTGASTTVTSTGTHFSGATGDITIKATANSVDSDSFSMTAHTPWKLVQASRTTSCGTSPETYSTDVSYNLLDNLSNTMSHDINWNEVVGTSTCENSSNWCNFSITTGSGATATLDDLLAPPLLTVLPTPVPTCTGTEGSPTRYRSIPQTIRVASSTSGSGVQVQSDTLGYYGDHGKHDSISSPTQPPQ